MWICDTMAKIYNVEVTPPLICEECGEELRVELTVHDLHVMEFDHICDTCKTRTRETLELKHKTDEKYEA